MANKRHFWRADPESRYCTLDLGGGGGSPPPPDYTGAAQAQGQASKEVTNMQNWANRPDQYTPWGSLTWNSQAAIDPATGQPVTQWTQQQQLNPALQGTLDQQLALQNQRTNLAGGFVNRVAQDYQQPFDWTNLPGAAGTPQQQYTYGRDMQSFLPSYSLDTNQRQGLTTGRESISPTGQDASGLQQRTTGNESISPTGQNTQAIQGMTTGYEGLSPTTQSTNEAAFSGDRNRIEQALFDRMRPEQQFQEDRVRTMLANQGLTPGSEAYNRELQTLQRNQADERYNAMNMAGSEQARLQQMLLGQQQQAFGQQQAAGQFGLGAQQQAFGQDITSQQQQNQALSNLFNQQQAAGQFGLGAQQQAFGQSAADLQARNQALQQQFAQQQAAGQFGLGAQQQGFQQDIAGQQAYNQSLAQQQALQQNAGSFYNQAQQQMFGQDQAANQQNFNQMMQSAEYQNRLRQQAIAEQAQQRGMSLNEMNALLTGQQVQSPQMPSFAQSQAAQTPNYLGAATASGQYNLAQEQADAQRQAGLWGGLGQMAGSAAALYALGAFSDIRLKSNIRRVGTHPVGVGIYDYDIFGRPERGVMAQELMLVRPDLVSTHPSGYLMVNYGGL